MIKKNKNTVPWSYVISDLNGGEICWNVLRKKIAKTNQNELRVEKKEKKKKAINYMLKGNATIIILTVGLRKKSINK